ncbi:hypothetical protein HPB51_002414 [Rhipicephalus microplus]|uniref:Uncharacterized protein n=1 Tax=Rhipicephalus microplus TaxID=6941 RepID=A0A9J6DT26_RHIMP|nr:hypothetical protein HPB51_002414 [Rhipicephalus microplus]
MRKDVRGTGSPAVVVGDDRKKKRGEVPPPAASWHGNEARPLCLSPVSLHDPGPSLSTLTFCLSRTHLVSRSRQLGARSSHLSCFVLCLRCRPAVSTKGTDSERVSLFDREQLVREFVLVARNARRDDRTREDWRMYKRVSLRIAALGRTETAYFIRPRRRRLLLTALSPGSQDLRHASVDPSDSFRATHLHRDTYGYPRRRSGADVGKVVSAASAAIHRRTERCAVRACEIVYLGAFIMELWWIIENNGNVDFLINRTTADEVYNLPKSSFLSTQIRFQLPVPAYVLAAGYFSIFLVSLFLLAGLFLTLSRHLCVYPDPLRFRASQRKSNYLLGWLFVSVLFFFPECGLALFMSLQYWKLDSKGIAELAFYIARAVMNVVCIVCIQSLYTQWKQEKAVMRRLQNLNVVGTPPYTFPFPACLHMSPHTGTWRPARATARRAPAAPRATAWPAAVPARASIAPTGNAGGGSLSSRSRYVTAADSEPTYIVAHNSALKRSTSSVSGLMVRAVGGGGHHQQGVYNAAFNGSLNGCVLGPSGVDFYAPNPALWAGPSPRSEFDASSFADLVARGGGGGGLLNGYRSMSRSTSELNRGEPWTSNGSAGAVAVSRAPLHSSGPVEYATQSLDRPKFRRQGGRNNRWEVLDVRGFGDVTLERLPERPFQYLNRPGSVVRGNESDTSSSHSIRDIAL